MSIAQGVLFIVGAFVEFVGIVLLGFPDFLPGALRLSNWLRRRTRPLVNRLRRVLGLSPLETVVNLSAALEASAALSLSVTRAVKPDATLEEQVAFLIRRDQEAQRDVDALVARVGEIEAETPRQLDKLEKRMETHVAQELAAALAVYRPLRVGGAVALAIGLVCVTVANFV